MPSNLTSQDMVELGAQEQDVGRQIQPDKKYDHRSERPVRRVEFAEFLHVEGEAKGRDYPDERCPDRTGCEPL